MNFERAQLNNILMITETKKKGDGKIETEEGHQLIYNEVPIKKRGAAGVACLIHKDLQNAIHHSIGWSERILSGYLKINKM